MSRKIQIISGLLTPSVSENVFINFLIEEGIEPEDGAIPLESARGHTIPADAVIIFILPILGDNDLLPLQVSFLKAFLKAHDLAGRKVMVVLKGDRHVSDEFVLDSYPIHVKLCNIFRAVTSFLIIDIKLDEDTAARIAHRVAHELEKPLTSYCREFDLLAGLLGRAPVWDPVIKKLDFDNVASGYSLLYEFPKSRILDVVNIVKSLRPKHLVINHAQMTPRELELFANLSTVLKVQLGSNYLTLESVFSVFPYCRWVSLAANQIRSFSLSNAGDMLESVLVHKNSLRELNLEPYLPCQLKRLSLYRNQVRAIEWPADQNSLENLNLGANPLSQLPESLAQARDLKFLGLARTGITNLPEWIFSLPALKEVDISHIEDRLPANQLGKLIEMGIHLIKKPA